MRTLIAASLTLFAILPSAAQAQIKLPVFTDEKARFENVSFQEATLRDDFQHGRVMRITLKSDKDNPIKGVLVRTDRKNDRIYVRTEAGATPRAIALNDIHAIEKGVIRNVSDDRREFTMPEIQTLEIYNGLRRSSTIVAPTLSSSEIARLQEYEAAANEMARVDALTRLEERTLENEVAMQEQQRRVQELITYMMWRRVWTLDYLPHQGIFLDPLVFAALNRQVLVGPAPVVVQPAAVAPTATTRVRLIDAETVAAARKRYVAAQSYVLIENGRLIAVLDQPAPATASASALDRP